MAENEQNDRPRLRSVPSPASPSPLPDVVVLGAGVIGLTCALELARQGARVEVVEKSQHGGAASTAAAGMLAPLSEIPSGGPFFEAARDSRNRWVAFRHQLEEESGLSVDYDDSGALMIARNEKEEAEMGRFEAAAHYLGEEAGELPLPEARHRVPDLTPEARRCLHLPGEHRVDNVKALAALNIAAERRGVTVSRGRQVEGIAVHKAGVTLVGPDWERSAGVVVLATGVGSAHLPGLPPLPVHPVRGQMLLLGGVDWDWDGIVRSPHLYTVRRGATGLLIGATVEEAGYETLNTVGGLSELLEFTRTLLPGLDSTRVETYWAGLRPGSPDGSPLLGPWTSPKVIAATGHYRNGILLAPWTAQIIASTILDGAPPPESEPFSPHRFDNR